MAESIFSPEQHHSDQTLMSLKSIDQLQIRQFYKTYQQLMHKVQTMFITNPIDE